MFEALTSADESVQRFFWAFSRKGEGLRALLSARVVGRPHAPARHHAGAVGPGSPRSSISSTCSSIRCSARLPGVLQAETTRAIPVRLVAGHRTYRTSITGLGDDAALQRILDSDLREKKPLPGGALLTTRLAQRLGVAPGDTVIAELLEGERVKAPVPVTGTVHELVGMNAYMRGRRAFPRRGRVGRIRGGKRPRGETRCEGAAAKCSGSDD